MEFERFDEVMDEIFFECKELCQSKNAEYARGSDKLHNFKKAGKFLKSGSQVDALRGMLLKHTVSIYDMMDDHVEGKQADPRKWKEKIHDHIIYLVLLYAMVEEEYKYLRTTDFSVKIPVTHDMDCDCTICTADLAPSDTER